MTTPSAPNNEVTVISQRTAAALADLYASYFGRIYSFGLIQSRVKNTELADFLFKQDFSDQLRQRALPKVSPEQVREFILSILQASRTAGGQNIPWILAQAIVTEIKSLWSKDASQQYRHKVEVLLQSMSDDGYILYKGILLTSQELLDEFGVLFNPETREFIDMQDSNQVSDHEVPSAETLLLSIPLYKTCELEPDSYARLLYDLGNEHLTVDSYCVECGRSSTFKRTIPYFQNAHLSPAGSYYEVTLLCARQIDHRMKFYIRVQKNSIVKVGQHPSLADLVQGDVRKYRTVLAERYTEFTRAIGLAAHGVGVGSFVYLRRIFEDLIAKALVSASDDAEWQQTNAPGFLEKRMSEKILLLKDFLPDFLVENREMYGILSKGVHDLTEQECLTYFPVVQNGIELILDEEIERLDKKRKTSVAQKAIDAIGRSIANKPTDV